MCRTPGSWSIVVGRGMAIGGRGRGSRCARSFRGVTSRRAEIHSRGCRGRKLPRSTCYVSIRVDFSGFWRRSRKGFCMNRKGVGHKGEIRQRVTGRIGRKRRNARVQHRRDGVRCVRQVQVTCKRVPRERLRRSTPAQVHNNKKRCRK